MKRLHEANINTPEWFDHVWKVETVHRYDAVRLRAFTKHIKDGDSVLDIGCGVFGFLQYAHCVEGKRGQFTAMDFSAEALAQTAQHVRIMRGADWIFETWRHDITTGIPGKHYQYDVVGCGELIEHMETPQALVDEMARVCKSGGWLLCSTVNPECEDAKRHGDYPEHLWQFEPAELVAMFSQYGPTAYREVGDYHFIETRKT